jgi:hypothetical protein
MGMHDPGWASEQDRLRAAIEIGVELLESGRTQLAAIVLRLALDPEATLPTMGDATAARLAKIDAEIGALRNALRSREDPRT